MFKYLSIILFLFSSLLCKIALAKIDDSTSGPRVTTHALIISISSYPKEEQWPTANSTDDISNITTFLNKFTANATIHVLQDKNATKKNIVEKINLLMQTASSGDKVYLHFSGGGLQLDDKNNEETDGLDEAFMPYDAPSFTKVNLSEKISKADLSHLILDDEMVGYIELLRKKLTSEGQIFFTIDASYFGPPASASLSTVGRGGFLEVNTQLTEAAPFIMITSCLEKQNSFFLRSSTDTLPRSFSTALKNYIGTLSSADKISYSEFFSGLSKALRKLSPSQTPSISGDFSGNLVLNDLKVSRGKKSELIAKDAKLYILSIGISNYKGPYDFDNCADDARLFTETISTAFRELNTGPIKAFQLLDNEATKEAIISAINNIAIEAKDNDVFAFFFAGFTNQPELSENNFAETWFYPVTQKPVSIFSRIGFQQSEVITLTELKKILDYLKCDKQLLFTEAGPSKNFKREFVKSMIKTNPVIADIVKRNRVIIVPTDIGLDQSFCKETIEHGPGLFYFNKLKDSLVNVFELFSADKNAREKVLFKYSQIQHECRFMESDYMSFFFEKEFVEDLQYYFAREEKDESSTRSIGESDSDKKRPPEIIKNKYALVIGTNKFNNFDSLENPLNDAKSISDTLSSLFGFKTKLMKSPTLGEIYTALYSYNSILKDDDQFLLYIAGHGHYDTTIYQDGFIVTRDSKPLEADTFLTSFIPFNQLRTITDNFKAKQVMVLLDVCFSGAFDNNEEVIGGNLNYNLAYKLDARSVNKKLQMVTRKYITAGSRIEKVPDNFKGGHSPFAWFLLEGLRRAAKEKKYISSGMLFKYIQVYLEDTVPLQSGFGKDQLRLGSEFIFMTKED